MSNPPPATVALPDLLSQKDALIKDLQTRLEEIEMEKAIKKAFKTVSRRASSIPLRQSNEFPIEGEKADEENSDSDSDEDEQAVGADSKSFSALMKKLGEEREDKNGYVEAFEEGPAMNCYRVERRAGWDFHRLPVEYEIDQKLKVTHRDQVLAMGIENYNKECRSIVTRYTKEWETTVTRPGRWIDFENDYKSPDPSFMESVWWVFKELFNKDMVYFYQGYKVMPFSSTACGTPLFNFEAGLNYKEGTKRAPRTPLSWSLFPLPRTSSDKYVTDDSGTGIVHEASAFGEDDCRVCLAQKIIVKGGDIPCPVGSNEIYTEKCKDFLGQYVKDADPKICEKLKVEGRFVQKDVISHYYPFCWRSDTPLIYKAVPSWFVKVEEIRDRLLKNNAQTHWVTQHVKVRGHRGTTSTGRRRQDRDPSKKNPGTTLKRIDEVFDCWFESGSMPYAQKHYPFENAEQIASKVIIHDKPSTVADYLIENKTNGALRRYTLDTIDNTTIALWQHRLLKGKVVVEYLLEICRIEQHKILGSKLDTRLFTLNTIDDDDLLSRKAFGKYEDVKSKRSGRVRANLKMGKIKLEECELGQSMLSMHGELSLQHPELAKNQGTTAIWRMSSTPGADRFDQPSVIDKRRKERFLNEMLKNPPPLTSQEKELLETTKPYKDVINLASLHPTTLAGDVQHFTKKESRFFEEWRTWEKIEDDNAGEDVPSWKSKYMLSFAPMSEYDGTKNAIKDKEKYLIAGTTSKGLHIGAYFIHSIGPNVCNFIKVVKVNLNLYTKVPHHAIIKSYMAFTSDLKEDFRRNATTVDSELRAVTVSEMSMVKSSEYLTTTQSDIFKTLEDLANKQTWERSNHRLYNRELNGIDVLSCEDIFKNGLPGLKVKFTVDCTAAEAAAWFFDPITKKGITRNKFSAFLRVAQHTGTNLVNERTFATVISNQISFFKPREFVDKRIWKVEDSGSVKIAVWPEQEISCDYGEYFGDTVRCFTKALFCATDVDAANSESSLKQCNVTLTKFIQGRRPTLGSRSAYTYDLLRTVNHLCEDLRQDEKVDKATLEDFLKRLKNDEISHDYSHEDKAMLERGSVLFKMLTGRSSDLRVQLKSSHTAVTARCGFTNDGDAKYFAAYSSVVVDADVDSCLAYAYLMDSRERMMSSNYSIISKIHKKTGDHSCIVLNKLKSKLGKRRRQAIMLSKVIWKRNLKSKTAMLYMEDNEELKRSISVLKNVDAKIIKNGFSSAGHKVVLLLKKLPEREGKVAQTWLKLYSVVDLNSLDALPRKHKMRVTKSFTEVASAMRQRFDRSQDIDLKNMAKVYILHKGHDNVTSLTATATLVLLPSTVVSFIIFMLAIKREYWPTFINTQRGKDLT
ncbi:hypothetical protein TrRE_jg6241, partial [Triparma retinervis]